jgi:hypothetical protein
MAGKRSPRFGHYNVAGEVHKTNIPVNLYLWNEFLLILKLSILARPLGPRYNFIVNDKQVFY